MPRTDKETLFEAATYLVASARDCIDEPAIYGPLRLLVGVDRLIQLSESDGQLADGFLSSMKGRIGDEVLSVMSDREAFLAALEGLLLEFAEEAKRRNLGHG
jgi:hypothetical protein